MGLPLSRVDNNDLTGLLTSIRRYIWSNCIHTFK